MIVRGHGILLRWNVLTDQFVKTVLNIDDGGASGVPVSVTNEPANDLYRDGHGVGGCELRWLPAGDLHWPN